MPTDDKIDPPTLAQVLEVAREPLDIWRRTSPAPWAVTRHDEIDCINWQVQSLAEEGDVIANIGDDEDKRARADAHAIAHANDAAPRLAGFAIAIGPALEEWRAAQEAAEKLTDWASALVARDAADSALLAACDRADADATAREQGGG